MNVLEVNGLEKQYKEKTAVQNLSFSLKEGHCTALLGPNGAGKTTTLNMLSGLISPTKGTITMTGNKKGKDLRQQIGYLPQYPAFFEWMSGNEFLVFSGEIAGLTRTESKERATELLTTVGLEEGKNRRIGQYSGGMRQRLGIAQALIHRPRLVILDEPVSALDPFGRKEILELLKKLKSETTILFSTHILNDAEQVCDDVLFLHNGRLVEQGSLSTIKVNHRAPQIILHLEDRVQEIASQLEELSDIQSISIEGNRIKASVTDIHSVRKEILHRASEQNWLIEKLEMSTDSLEEIFMKVVK